MEGKMEERFEGGRGGWFPGQCVKEFKEQAGIQMKDSSFNGNV